jgi:hypothetical protein
MALTLTASFDIGRHIQSPKVIDALRRRVELRYRDKDIDRYFAQALDGETELELLT